MVYIDDFNHPYLHMIMCHMVADTTEELLTMCDKIGVKRKWVQDYGTSREHFDICITKKEIAVKEFGAIPVGFRELASMTGCRDNPNQTLVYKKINANPDLFQ